MRTLISFLLLLVTAVMPSVAFADGESDFVDKNTPNVQSAIHDPVKLLQIQVMELGVKPVFPQAAAYYLEPVGDIKYVRSVNAATSKNSLRMEATAAAEVTQPNNADSITRLLKARAVESAINIADMTPAIGTRLSGDGSDVSQELQGFKKNINSFFAVAGGDDASMRTTVMELKRYYESCLESFQGQLEELKTATMPSAKRKLALRHLLQDVKARREEMCRVITSITLAQQSKKLDGDNRFTRPKMTKEKGKELLSQWVKRARVAAFQTVGSVR